MISGICLAHDVQYANKPSLITSIVIFVESSPKCDFGYLFCVYATITNFHSDICTVELYKRLRTWQSFPNRKSWKSMLFICLLSCSHGSRKTLREKKVWAIVNSMVLCSNLYTKTDIKYTRTVTCKMTYLMFNVRHSEYRP